jgi:hypothetical protein
MKCRFSPLKRFSPSLSLAATRIRRSEETRGRRQGSTTKFRALPRDRSVVHEQSRGDATRAEDLQGQSRRLATIPDCINVGVAHDELIVQEMNDALKGGRT